MPTTKRYRVLVSWVHRKWGKQSCKLSAEGSSLRRALNNALLGFFSDRSNRERRRDGHRELTVTVSRQRKQRPNE
jgi:hypothetical protein